MHQALRLFKNGATTADIVSELNFTDQAHLTHASKQLFGYTPKMARGTLAKSVMWPKFYNTFRTKTDLLKQ